MFGLIFVQACCSGEPLSLYSMAFHCAHNSVFLDIRKLGNWLCLVWFTSALFHKNEGKKGDQELKCFKPFLILFCTVSAFGPDEVSKRDRHKNPIEKSDSCHPQF